MDLIARRTRFWFTESGEGEPVICIHGNGASRVSWRHFVPEASKNFRVIVYELRGTGESETIGNPRQTFTIKDHAEDLAAIMDVLGLKKAAIVAQAFGAFISMQFAALYPERVSAMVVHCTSARVEGKTRQGLPKWAEIVEKEGNFDSLLDEAMVRWFTDSFKNAHPEVVDLYRKMYAANPAMGYAANCRGIVEYDIVDQLHKIKCPTLVIAGESDASTPVKDSELVVSKIPNSELVLVKDASHAVSEEQPEEFNQLTINYLKKNL
ncbi:MAG: 3-oxoadipate enol-lactonase 2 [Candidatus Dichloromethanomonas elyunquensis]|nr:MAG: 3-oxoadipate enol-lactonase 2 [Candidatus Dichloromethanomonas elyunquensis]